MDSTVGAGWQVWNADVIHKVAPILQQQVAQVGLNELEIRLVVARSLTAAWGDGGGRVHLRKPAPSLQHRIPPL